MWQWTVQWRLEKWTLFQPPAVVGVLAIRANLTIDTYSKGGNSWSTGSRSAILLKLNWTQRGWTCIIDYWSLLHQLRSQTGDVWYLQSDVLQHRPGEREQNIVEKAPVTAVPEVTKPDILSASAQGQPSVWAPTPSTEKVEVQSKPGDSSRQDTEPRGDCKRCDLSAMEAGVAMGCLKRAEKIE